MQGRHSDNQPSKVPALGPLTPPLVAPAGCRMRVTVTLLVLLLWGSPVVGGAWRGAGRAKARGRARQGTTKRFAQECMEYTEAGERYLDCQERRLSVVPAGQHSDVKHLLLARNQIHVLPDDAFAHFPNLRSLDLQHNELSQVSRRAFVGLARLTTLLLQHNGLRDLDEETLLPLPLLTYLRLYDNPWDCRCPLDSLVRTLQVPGNRNLGNYAECAEPHTLRGHRLKRVKPERLCSSLEDNALQEPEGPGTTTTGGAQRPYTSTACKSYMSLLDCRDGGEHYCLSLIDRYQKFKKPCGLKRSNQTADIQDPLGPRNMFTGTFLGIKGQM